MTGATDPLVSIDLVAAFVTLLLSHSRDIFHGQIKIRLFFLVEVIRTRRTHERTYERTYAKYACGRIGIVSLSWKRARVRTLRECT